MLTIQNPNISIIIGLCCLMQISNMPAQNLSHISGDVQLLGRLKLVDSIASISLGDDAGSIHQGVENTFIGEKAGAFMVLGNRNTWVGANVGFGIDSGDNNTIFGSQFPFFGTNYGINRCTFIGHSAGNLKLDGRENTIVGSFAGSGQLGDYNCFLGASAGQNIDSVDVTTSLGFESGYLNSEPSNCFVGARSGRHNALGFGNTFLGTSAGFYNSEGGQNTFIGREAGLNNRSGQYNVFVGTGAGKYNIGFQNTYLGYESGHEGRRSNINTYIGWHAGYLNEGICNILVGSGSGAVLQGDDNVFIGSVAGSGATSATHCLAIGFEAGFTGNFSNAISIGSQTSCNASNKVRIGNNQVSTIEGQVNFSAVSDYRLKENITYFQSGLNFIRKLRPVNYTWVKNPDITSTGLIAQEVEQAANDLGFKSSAVIPSSGTVESYSLRYAELVMPLINAINDIATLNMNLIDRIAELESQLKVDGGRD